MAERGKERKASASGSAESSSVLFRNEGGLYPDTEVAERIKDLPARVDFIARLCAAWDFGILPLPDTVDEILKGDWREAVSRCRLLGGSMPLHGIRIGSVYSVSFYFGGAQRRSDRPQFPLHIDPFRLIIAPAFPRCWTFREN